MAGGGAVKDGDLDWGRYRAKGDCFERFGGELNGNLSEKFRVQKPLLES